MKRTLYLGVVAALLLAGCAGESSGEKAPAVITSVNGMKLLVSSYSGEGMEANFEGTLEAGEGNCLYLVGGTVPSLLFWPEGTEFSSDETAVERPGSPPLVIGRKIRVSGGGIDLESDANRYPEIPSDCSAEYLVRVN